MFVVTCDFYWITQLEGSDAAPDDPVHLKRRVGLFSGVALIVGTMIGMTSLLTF